MTSFRTLAALALVPATLVLSAPAHAYSDEQLSCIEREASDDVSEPIMQTLFQSAGLIEEAPEEPLAPFFEVTQKCAYELDMPDEMLGQFSTYVLTSLAGQEARDRLVAIGIDMDAIDGSLGITWRDPDAPQFVITEPAKDVVAEAMTAQIEELELGFQDRMHALLYVGFYMSMAQGWSEVVGPLVAYEG